MADECPGKVVQIASGKPRKTKPRPEGDPIRNATYARLCRLLRDHYASRLSYDAMREAPCLDGNPLRDADIGRMREAMENDHGFAFAPENVAAGVRQIAEEHTYHPVQQYLRGLVWDGVVRLPRVAPEILGVDTPLAVVMLRRFFVSAVARALRPGCKVDTSLVLVGDQGFRKSMFFDVLGGAWYSDTNLDISSKDGLLQLAGAWIYEWPEIDRVTTRRHSSDVKAFLTGRVDAFRPPFARAVVQHPRACVIVGSTNEPRYLVDQTGSRRFWTVEIRRNVDVALLRSWRDQLWAEAVVALEQGETWWLDDAEDEARAEHAIEHHAVDSEDPWAARIDHWLRATWGNKLRDPRSGNEALTIGGDALTLSVLLGEALAIRTADQDEFTGRRVSRIMRSLGYDNEQRVTLADGRRLRVWSKEAGRAKP